MSFERGTRATEFESSVALVEQPLERVLHFPGTCPGSSLSCTYYMISKKEQLGSLLGEIQAPHEGQFQGPGANLFLVYFLVIYIFLSPW